MRNQHPSDTLETVNRGYFPSVLRFVSGHRFLGGTVRTGHESAHVLLHPFKRLPVGHPDFQPRIGAPATSFVSRQVDGAFSLVQPDSETQLEPTIKVAHLIHVVTVARKEA